MSDPILDVANIEVVYNSVALVLKGVSLQVAEGKPFASAGLALLPKKNATAGQAEQVSRSLELLLLVLSDATRLREGHALRLEPWRERIQTLARSSLVMAEPQRLVFEALRNLVRNPYAESLLREVAMALR